MVEILYMFSSFSPAVFTVVAILCLAVGVIGYRFDKPCVVVVSLLLGFGIGYFVSMAAWQEGIGTLYLGSCIGLISLLVSIKVLPVKRFFLGGVSVFLAVAVACVVIINAVTGTDVTYSFQSLSSGSYQDVQAPGRNNDIKVAFAEVANMDKDDVKATISEDKMTVKVHMPASNLAQLTEYGELLAAHGTFAGIDQLTVESYSSAWTPSLIIAAVFGIACGVLTMFKPKIMQIIGTSVFAGVCGSAFAYLGLGELGFILTGPIFCAGGIALQRFINRNRDTDVKISEDYRSELVADTPV